MTTPLFTTFEKLSTGSSTREGEGAGSSDKTLFLYHGTGGNETDLLSLIEPFMQSHSVVGLRGNVLENGMPRFFRRIGFGNFDQDNIKEEVEKLVTFINKRTESNSKNVEDIIHVGYSNGANFILAAIFYYPELFQKAALLHPMLPFTPNNLDLSKKEVLVTWGKNDPIITGDQSNEVIAILKKSKAIVTDFENGNGHNLTHEEVTKLHEFIAK